MPLLQEKQGVGKAFRRGRLPSRQAFGYLVRGPVRKLLNTVMGYDWGSRTAIAEILGRPVPSPGPEAEMWIGVHAAAPSMLEEEGGRCTLAEWIARSPEARLGSRVRERFEGRLPFLLKILAAETPLSLQAHPSLEQARAGHAREDAAGIPRTAPNRNYRDANHKPEILCALGRFDALCGFRPADRTLRLLRVLQVESLAPVVDAISRTPGPGGLKEAFSFLMTLPRERAAVLVDEVAEACRRECARGSEGSAQFEWVIVLADLYPADVGVVASLLLNHVRLEAGQALFLPAGNLHSYLGGVGIELMASSDNVLRGGLTSKHVDVDELLTVVDFSDRPARFVPVRTAAPGETEYVTGTPDFRLSTVVVGPGAPCRPSRRGPELLLCTSGAASAETVAGETVELRRGEAVFVGADEGDYVLKGDATLFRATVGDDTD